MRYLKFKKGIYEVSYYLEKGFYICFFVFVVGTAGLAIDDLVPSEISTPILFRKFPAPVLRRRKQVMEKEAPSSADSSSKDRSETPEKLRQALKSAAVASAELVQTSKSLLQSTSPQPSVPSKQPPLAAIATLAGLVHSHTVRTALTCGPTASSPSATLGCVKDLHEPILPMMAEYQNLAAMGEYPQFFVAKVRQAIIHLLDSFGPFVAEVVEIASGHGSVDSRERLQYSGVMMECTKRIQNLCTSNPIFLLRTKLKETQGMLDDAVEELQAILDPSSAPLDDGWSDETTTPPEYTPDQKSLAARVEKKLRLLQFLYKATSKRRMTNVTYSPSMHGEIDVVNDLLTALAVDVDNLVSGISAAEEAMGLELLLVQVEDAGLGLARAIRVPFTGISDDREGWFDTWIEKFA
jgi:Grap2 and cyclin-D-interacting